MENNTEGLEPQNNPEGEPTPKEGGQPTPDDGEGEMTPEEIAELKHKAEVSSQNFERAKKLEAELREAHKKLKDSEPAKNKDDFVITPKDNYALMVAKVHADDYDEVVDWAKFKKISVAKALEDKKLQVFLRERDEERNTASATNSRGGRGITRTTPDEIVNRARTGALPEDDDGIAKLVKAQFELKTRALKK